MGRVALASACLVVIGAALAAPVDLEVRAAALSAAGTALLYLAHTEKRPPEGGR